MTDFKLEKWKREEELQSMKRSDNVSKIYGCLWQVLHDLEADRVYIIQPHPLTDSLFISISLEVKRNGVVSMKGVINRISMGDVAVFCSDLAKRDFLFYSDINENVKDKKAAAILSSNGTVSAIIKRLGDDNHDWIGSIVCEFTHSIRVSGDFARQKMLDASRDIQYILPVYKDLLS